MLDKRFFLFRVLINQLVVLLHLKEFHFYLVVLFCTHSGLSLIPGFPRTCCSLIPCADACLLSDSSTFPQPLSSVLVA